MISSIIVAKTGTDAVSGEQTIVKGNIRREVSSFDGLPAV